MYEQYYKRLEAIRKAQRGNMSLVVVDAILEAIKRGAEATTSGVGGLYPCDLSEAAAIARAQRIDLDVIPALAGEI